MEAEVGVSQTQHRSLEAVLIKACPKCHAPGVWRAPLNEAQAQHYANWPAIIVPVGDPLDGKPVGDRCPCCGAFRKGLMDYLGVIWKGFLPGRRTLSDGS